MTFLFPLLLLLFYLYIRKIWFQLRRIKTLGSIERIDLEMFSSEIILPEVKVSYKYYFQGGVYFGKGYLLLEDFLDGEEYEAYCNENGVLVLDLYDARILTSEHIEAYLLSLYGSVFVYMDPIEPYHSRLESLNKTSSIGVPYI